VTHKETAPSEVQLVGARRNSMEENLMNNILATDPDATSKYTLTTNSRLLLSLLNAHGARETDEAAAAIGVSLNEFERTMAGGMPTARFMAGAVMTVPATLSELFDVVPVGSDPS
jgi:hypothetical protein